MSQLIHHQDPVTDLLQVFDAMFRLVIPGPGRKIIGLTGISEKQSGAPGWYLWFEDRPGAYLLELVVAETVSEEDIVSPSDRGGARGTYWIKYYPAVDDLQSLHAFSDIEQTVRTGGCFDNTGTPDFEKGDGIPETFFLIGAIEASLTADGSGLSLCLESLDHWVTSVVAANGSQPDERGVKKDRNIPAWNYSWFLFDRLILTLCLAYRTSPLQISLHEQPGHKFHMDLEGTSRAVPDDKVHERRLSTSFLLQEGHTSSTSHTHRNARADLQDDFSRLSASCDGKSSVPNPWISPGWWHIHKRHTELGGALPC